MSRRADWTSRRLTTDETGWVSKAQNTILACLGLLLIAILNLLAIVVTFTDMTLRLHPFIWLFSSAMLLLALLILHVMGGRPRVLWVFVALVVVEVGFVIYYEAYTAGRLIWPKEQHRVGPFESSLPIVSHGKRWLSNTPYAPARDGR